MAQIPENQLLIKRRKTEIKLCDSLCEILISEVQTRPALWNDQDDNFKNSSITRKLWEEVGAAIDIPGEEAKRKWKNLKDKYRKLLQLPPPRSGAAAAGRPKKQWRFFELMQFTKDTMAPSVTIGSLNRATSTPSINDDNQFEDFEEDLENTEEGYGYGQAQENDELVDLTMNHAPSLPEPVSTARPHRSKASLYLKQDLQKRMVQLEEKKIEAIMNLNSSKERNPEENGDDYHFLMSLLPFMKSLEPLQKLELRNKLQNEVLSSYRAFQEKNAAAVTKDQTANPNAYVINVPHFELNSSMDNDSNTPLRPLNHTNPFVFGFCKK